MFHALMHHPFMERLRKPCYGDAAKLIPRLTVGGIFARYGYMKFTMGIGGVAGYFGKLGIPAPGVLAPFVAGLELFGGILLMLGFATRLIGFLLSATMLVAIGTAFGWKFSKAELELLLGVVALSLSLSDGGAYSLDAWLLARSRKAHASALPAVKA